MFDRLPESRARRGDPAGGTFASVILHALMLSLAVALTARARTETVPDKGQILNWVSPPAPGASAPTVAPRAKPAPTRPVIQPAPLSRPAPPDITIEQIDPLGIAPVAAVAATPVGAESGAEGTGSVTASAAPEPGGIFDASQVERQVSLRSRAAPRYPAALQYAGIEGRVLVQFVVDENGRADVSTLRFLDSAHELFSRSVRDVLPQLRFAPAEIGGRRVSQLVHMPFDFRLDR